MAIDWDHSGKATLQAAEVIEEKVFLAPQSPDLDFLSSNLTTYPRMTMVSL